MAFCKNCGKELEDNATFCGNCGAAQDVAPAPTVEPTPVVEPEPQYQQPQPPVVDNGGFGWGLLGCCVPIVGLILFLVWKDTKPKSSKAAGIGALVSVIVYVVYIIAMVAIGVGVGMSGM